DAVVVGESGRGAERLAVAQGRNALRNGFDLIADRGRRDGELAARAGEVGNLDGRLGIAADYARPIRELLERDELLRVGHEDRGILGHSDQGRELVSQMVMRTSV